MTILFVTNPEQDAHILGAINELQNRGHQIFTFNPGKLPVEAKVSIEASKSRLRRELTVAGQTLDLDTVDAAWFRKPSAFEISHDLPPEERDWLRVECNHLVRSLWENTDAFWVSDPHLVQRANHKLLQLQIAREMGFDIPAYIVTNRADEARAFVASHSQGVIVKALARPTLESLESPGMIYTHRLSEEDVLQLDAVNYGPTYLQEFVKKKFDIRVSVFGNRLFAVAIDATGSPEGQIDFRRLDMFKIPHHAIQLPPALEAKCIELVRRLGLNYGAIDFLQTPDDDFIFLEINPNGQWIWMEMLTDLPMTQALCDLLEGGIPEHARPARPQSVATASVARSEPQTLPIGDQTLSLPASAARWLDASGAHKVERLAATNVIFEEEDGKVSVHFGDIEPPSD